MSTPSLQAKAARLGLKQYLLASHVPQRQLNRVIGKIEGRGKVKTLRAIVLVTQLMGNVFNVALIAKKGMGAVARELREECCGKYAYVKIDCSLLRVPVDHHRSGIGNKTWIYRDGLD